MKLVLDKILQLFYKLFHKKGIPPADKSKDSATKKVKDQTELDKKLIRTLRKKQWPKLKQLKYIPRILSKKEKRILQILCVIIILSAATVGINIYFRYFTLEPAYGGQYVEGLIGSPQFINPLLASNNDVDLDISRIVFSGLLKYDKNLNLVEDLAESYQISDDKKTYTFRLRDNLTWHDGEKLDADDVVFTFETILDPEFKSPLLKSFQGVEIEKIDERTVKFILKEPFAPFIYSLTFGILPKHIWKNIPTASSNLTEYNQRPIGSGPYQFDSLIKEKKSGNIREYKLIRYENYYGKRPYIDTLIFKFYPSFEEAVTALKNREVEGLSFLPKQYKEEEIPTDSINLYSINLSQYTAIFFNQKQNKQLKDKNVRMALAYSIDKEKILNEALLKEAEIIDGPILPGFVGYNPDLEKFEYNPEKANQLLDKSGWERISKDEYRKQRKQEELAKIKKQEEKENKEKDEKPESENHKQQAQENTTKQEETITSNKESVEQESQEGVKTQEQIIDEMLDIEFKTEQEFFRKKDTAILTVQLTTVDQPSNVESAKLIQKFWQSVGVKTNIRIASGNEMKKEIIKNRDYEALLYAEAIGNDPDPYPFWHSSQNEYPGLNLSIFANREVDELLEDARKITDPEKRRLKYRHFQNILVAELPAIFLYNTLYTYPQSTKIKGFDIQRISVPADRFNNIDEWYVKTKRVFTGWNSKD